MKVNPDVPSVITSNAEKKNPVEKATRKCFQIDFQSLFFQSFSHVNSAAKPFQSISQCSVLVYCGISFLPPITSA